MIKKEKLKPFSRMNFRQCPENLNGLQMFKYNLLLIHAVFHSYNLEYLACCTVFHLCQSQPPSPGFSFLFYTLFPTWGFYLVTRKGEKLFI